MERTGPSFMSRVVAVAILAVAAWVLFRVIVGFVTGVAWMVAALVVVVGVIWALGVLRR